MDSTMRLSEAMRLGAMLRPQGFGQLFEAYRHGRPKFSWRADESAVISLDSDLTYRSCALGAALEAIGDAHPGDLHIDHYALAFPTTWDAGLREAARCPVPGCGLGDDLVLTVLARPLLTVAQLIPHLNDDHRWTREQIADFIETIEHRIACRAESSLLVPAPYAPPCPLW